MTGGFAETLLSCRLSVLVRLRALKRGFAAYDGPTSGTVSRNFF